MIRNNKKTKLEKKEWQKELESVYATAVFNKSNDLKDLYIKLETVALKYINDRKMPEGTEFIIDVGTYPALKMKFFAPFSEVYEYDEKNDNWDKVLSKQNNAKFEYNNVLDFYNDLLKRTGQFIGEKFPKDLYATINKSNPGDLLKFEHGNTYVCIQNDSKGLFLKKVKDKDDKLSLKAFNNSEVIEITTFENDLQKFYADNRAKSGNLNLHTITVNYMAQEYINNITANLKEHSTKTIDFGPVRLHVNKKSDNTLRWFNKNGQIVDEKDVKTLIGYFNAHGIEREYKRNTQLPIKMIDDIDCEKEVEELINNKKYPKAYNVLKKHVENNKKSLIITNSGYKLENGNYIATGYSFAYKDGEVKLYKLSYQNNDITSVQKVENEVSEQEFIDFYKEAYMHHQYELLKANKNYIDNRYKNISHDIERKIVKDLSEKEILKSDDGEQKVTLTEHENVQIKYTDEDIDNLLDSFDYNNSDFEDINDYDFDPADDD